MNRAQMARLLHPQCLHCRHLTPCKLESWPVEQDSAGKCCKFHGKEALPVKILGVGFHPDIPNGSATITTSHGDEHFFDNAIAGWTTFIQMVDSEGRQRIGDQLEVAGYNRYTGEKEAPLDASNPL